MNNLEDEVVPLAFALQRNPGVYAVLAGAGLSMGAGLPSAWDVRIQLLEELAQGLGESPNDLEGWYRARFDESPSYHNLFERLGRSAPDRQALLRDFFEQSNADADPDSPGSSAAHDALASLVKSQSIRIILTTNFDRLLEAALTRAGIQPVVVTDAASLESLAPLHTQRCLVVHLHGDYLSPAAIRNTQSELETYPESQAALITKIANEYGLIVVGWSAQHDAALTRALEAAARPFYPSYWVDPFPLSDAAELFDVTPFCVPGDVGVGGYATSA